MNIPFKKRKLFDGCFSDCNGRRIVDRISDSNASPRESSGLYLEIMKYFKYELLLLLLRFLLLLMAYSNNFKIILQPMGNHLWLQDIRGILVVYNL